MISARAEGENTQVHFAGDLIEEGGPPIAFDGFPAEWGQTLRRLARLPSAPFVPGHGRSVARAFVERQALAFEQLADVCGRVDQETGDAEVHSAALAGLSDLTRAVLGSQATVAVGRYYQVRRGNYVDLSAESSTSR